AKEANRQALQSLAGGASAIRFHLSVASLAELQVLLNDIAIEYIATHFVVRSNNEAVQLIAFIVQYCKEKSIDTKALRGSVQRDVIEALSEGDSWKEIATHAQQHFSQF